MKERECRTIVKARANHNCERCYIHETIQGLTLHHRIKRSQGGPWLPSNCVMLCGHGTAGCHGWVEHNPDDANAEGFHVRPWQPLSTAVLYRGYWCLLDDSGGFTRVPTPQETA